MIDFNDLDEGLDFSELLLDDLDFGDQPASEGQLSYLEYLVLDGRVNLTKQWLQHYYCVRDSLTFNQANKLIELVKQFELEPVYPTMKEIGAMVEKRVNREP